MTTRARTGRGVGRQMRVFPDAAALAVAAAELLEARARQAVRERARFTVALSGGTTPTRLYEVLAARADSSPLPWDAIHVFWSDERAVPPDDPASNYGLAARLWLSRVPLPPGNVHRISGELPDPERAARAYQEELRRFFLLSSGQVPHFDLVLLGLGEDGHTASLFPRNATLAERRALVVATGTEESAVRRITLTLPVLNAAACVAFLVSGERKRTAMRRLLAGGPAAMALPASLVRPVGELLFLVDRAAAQTGVPT